ncbi:MAG: archaellin/type IV pilin N-terminal domain-containing protein [Candidatus Nanohaloarchaea archaeon]|nr:archaellin/type IV pilin N-terminal domain-containing protein [Candidatus Nanohaloarchaea archaeon]
MRKGVSPVVAVVLLLLMVVAAAGGVYVWTQGLLGGRQQRAAQELATQLEFRDVQCRAGSDASDELDFFLVNSGEVTVDGSEVRMYLYSVASGDLVTTRTVTHSDIQPGGTWDGSATFGPNMTSGREYRVEFEFVNQDSYTVTGNCQAS